MPITDKFRFWNRPKDDIRKKGRVPFSLGSKYTSVQGTRSLLTFFGDNVEGYDSLVSDRVDYEAVVGRKTTNSIATACLTWVITSVNSCPIEVGREEDGQFIPMESHPVLDLVAKPFGTDYDWPYLMGAMLTDYYEFGNAFALKIPDRDGNTKELQYLKAENVRPIANDATRLVSAYEYQPAGGQEIITFPAEQVWHIRYPIPDPKDPSVGISPLASVLRELYVDNLGSEVAAALMRKPRPSGILTPESSDIEVDQDTLDALKRRAEELSNNGRAGSIIGLSAGIKFTPISYSPKELALDEAKRKPEERVCAIFQIPPSVVGMGAGLDRSTYSNMAEARLAAWEDSIAPLQDHICASMMRCLFTEEDQNDDFIIRYDRSHVQVLVPDMVAIRQAARNDVMAGIITINEARAQQGLQSLDTSPFEDMGGQPIRENIVMPAQNQVPDPETLPGSQQEVQTRSFKRFDVDAMVFSDPVWNAEWEMKTALTERLSSIFNRLDDLAKTLASSSGPDSMKLVQRELDELGLEMARFAEDASKIITTAQRMIAENAIGEAARLASELQLQIDPFMGAGEDEDTDFLLLLGLIGLASNGQKLTDVVQRAMNEFLGWFKDGVGQMSEGNQSAEEFLDAFEGMKGRVSGRVRTIGQTEMHQAGRRTTQRIFNQSEKTLAYRRISARDNRVCVACWLLDGKLYQTSEMMPSHPNCRCRLIPVFGERARDESGMAFDALDLGQRKEILGPGLYEAFTNGARLDNFLEYSYDPVWGPTVTVSTVGNASVFADRKYANG